MLLACIAMLFAACHKDGVYNPSKKISKIYYVFSSGTKHLDEVWTWNKNNTLEKIDFYDDGLYKTYNFSYEKKRLVRMNDYGNNRSIEYKYDNKGLKEANYYRNGNLVETYTFTHKNGKISQITETYYGYKGGPDKYDLNALQFIIPDEMATAAFKTSKKIKKDSKGTYTCTYDLTWTKNNITKMVYNDYEDGETYSYETQYDKKNNPFYGAYLSFYFEENVLYQSKNNITRIEYTETEDGQTERSVINYEYTYDGQWPISIRYIDEDGYAGGREYEYTK